VSQQSRAISSAQAAASSAIDTQTAQDTVKAGTQASSVPSAGALIGGAQALVNVVNGLASVTANQPASTNAQAAASGVSAVLNNAQISTDSGQLTLPQIGISQSANGQLVVDQNKLKQAAVSNPAGVASLLSNTAQQLGQVASNALVAPVQASDKATLSGVSNGDSPYITQAVPTPAMQSSQPTLLAYSPSAQNLYGLAQYLSVSGL
jgi:flagellar capping protein FliD